MTFQFNNPAPVLWQLNALAPAAGGSLQFYAIGTTTPKNTWSDFARTVLNSNPVPLDSAGRPTVPIWLDGDYSVTLRDSGGVTVDTFDLRDPATGGTTIPALVSGEFLTNNGTTLQWDAIRQVPDPTGNANKILGTDGANLLWQNQQSIPQPDIANTSNSITIGDGTLRYRILTGTDTGPSTGTNQSTKAITFATAFSAPPMWIDVKVNKVPISGVALVATAITNITTTGFTATFDTADRHFAGNPDNYINATFPFTWIAIGQVAA